MRRTSLVTARALGALLILVALAPSAVSQVGRNRRNDPRRGDTIGLPRVDVGPGQGPRTPYLEEDWDTCWFVHRDTWLQLRTRLARQVAPGGIGDFRRLDGSDRTRVLDALTTALREGSPSLRAAACMALAKGGDPAAGPLLWAALDDASLDVRRHATLGLGVLAWPDGLARLATWIGDDDHTNEERFLAALALGVAGDTAALQGLRPHLDAAALARLPGLVQSGVLWGVAVTEDARFAPLLQEIWKARDDLELTARSRLVSALSRVPSPDHGPLVFEALDDSDRLIQRAAALGLGSMLASMGDDAVASALAQRIGDEAEAVTRNYLLLSLGRIGGARARTTLASRLNTRSSGVMRGGLVRPRVALAEGSRHAFAALGLGLTGDAAGLSSLTRQIAREPRIEHVSVLALALGLLGDVRAAPALASSFKETKDPTARSYISLALGMVGAQSSARALRRVVVEENDVELLPAASAALALLGQRAETQELLLERLDKRRSTGREAVLYCLGLIGDRTTVEPVVELLEDSRMPDKARAYAAVALGDLTDRQQPRALARLFADIDYTADPQLLQWLSTML